MPKLSKGKIFFSLPHPAPITLYCPAAWLNRPSPKCRLLRAFSAPAIVSLQSSSAGMPIAPRFQRSRNRFRLIALGRNADCSALPRSRNHFRLIVLGRNADCSALSALPQSQAILATRPAPFGRVALLRVSPCLPYVKSFPHASMRKLLTHGRAFLLHYTNPLG